MQKSVSYSGIMEAKSSVTLASKMTAEVVEVYYNEGDYVEAGSTIAKLDDSQLVASKETVKSKLDTLQVNYKYLEKEVADYYNSNPAVITVERLKADIEYVSDEKEKMEILFNDGIVSRNAYDEIDHQLKTMQSQLDEAQSNVENNYDSMKNQLNVSYAQLKELETTVKEMNLNIENSEILAPISGNIRMIAKEPGDLAIGGQPFAILDDRSVMTAKVSIVEKDLGVIKKNGEVHLKLTGRDEPIYAEVTRISPYMNNVTKMINIEIDLEKEEINKDIIIGSSVQVEFITSRANNQLVVDRRSLDEQLDGQFVFVIKEGIAVKTQIKTGMEVDDLVVVESGLNEGDLVAIKNLSNIYDEAKVFIYESEGE